MYNDSTELNTLTTERVYHIHYNERERYELYKERYELYKELNELYKAGVTNIFIYGAI
jgi:hypothetical protein